MQLADATASLSFAVFAASALVACWLLAVGVYRANSDQRQELTYLGPLVVAFVAVVAAVLVFGVLWDGVTNEKAAQTAEPPSASGSSSSGGTDPVPVPKPNGLGTEPMPGDPDPLVAAVKDLSGELSSLAERLPPERIDLQPVTQALEGIEARLGAVQREPDGSGEVVDVLLLIVLLALAFGAAWYLLRRGSEDPEFRKLNRIAKYVMLALSVIGGVLGVLGAVFATSKELFEAMAAYVEIGERTQLVSLITIPVDAAGVQPVSRTVPPVPSSVQPVPPNGETPIVQPHLLARSTTFMIPFEEEGRCKDLASGQDVLPSPEMSNFLVWFGSRLKACAKEGGEKVVLRVRGYASSSKVSEDALPACDAESSDQANLMFAEARSETVQKKLREACGTACTVLGESWHGKHHAMAQMRRYNDRVLKESGQGKYDEDRGMLTRRVEITIEDAADCAALPVRPVLGR